MLSIIQLTAILRGGLPARSMARKQFYVICRDLDENVIELNLPQAWSWICFARWWFLSIPEIFRFSNTIKSAESTIFLDTWCRNSSLWFWIFWWSLATLIFATWRLLDPVRAYSWRPEFAPCPPLSHYAAAQKQFYDICRDLDENVIELFRAQKKRCGDMSPTATRTTLAAKMMGTHIILYPLSIDLPAFFRQSFMWISQVHPVG